MREESVKTLIYDIIKINLRPFKYLLIFTAQRYANTVYDIIVCPSVPLFVCHK